MFLILFKDQSRVSTQLAWLFLTDYDVLCISRFILALQLYSALQQGAQTRPCLVLHGQTLSNSDVDPSLTTFSTPL